MKYFALIDPRLPEPAIKKMKDIGIEPVTVPLTPLVEEPVSGHPDIQVFLHKKIAFVHPEIGIHFIETLGKYCEVRVSGSRLSRAYPGDVAYNIAVTGCFAFHRKDSSDPSVLEYLAGEAIEIVNTNQGYAKCSTLIVDDQSIITADTSIHKAATAKGVNSLLITPGCINLPGYKYGFIGGASGRFMDMIIFTGSIEHHPDYERIYSFIESRELNVVLLSDEPALDTGSILISSY